MIKCHKLPLPLRNNERIKNVSKVSANVIKYLYKINSLRISLHIAIMCSEWRWKNRNFYHFSFHYNFLGSIFLEDKKIRRRRLTYNNTTLACFPVKNDVLYMRWSKSMDTKWKQFVNVIIAQDLRVQ